MMTPVFAVTDFQVGLLAGSAVTMAFLLPAMAIMNSRWRRLCDDTAEQYAEYVAAKEREAGGAPRWGEDEAGGTA